MLSVDIDLFSFRRQSVYEVDVKDICRNVERLRHALDDAAAADAADDDECPVMAQLYNKAGPGGVTR